MTTRFYSALGADEEVYLLPILSEFNGQHHASVRIETVDGRLVANSEVDMLIREG